MKQFFPKDLPSITKLTAMTPYFIAAWLKHGCEPPDKSSQLRRHRESHGYGATHAMKMRASASFMYCNQLGNERTYYSRTTDGSWHGNPVQSNTISTYFASLKRSKVLYHVPIIITPILMSHSPRQTRAGEASESVRAITIDTLRDLYAYNAGISAPNRPQQLPRGEHGIIWGGANQRLMMQLVYAIAFQCFLRIQEALEIKVRNIRILDEETGKIEITLDYRKTHQNGGTYQESPIETP